MKTFHCNHCQQLVFFENSACLQCSHRLAFLPDLIAVGSLEQTTDGLWRSPLPPGGGETALYRLCRNYETEQVCNWAIPASDPEPLCLSCRVTEVIPDLSNPANREAWFKLETAKRRLMYGLLDLGLPIEGRRVDPDTGLAFRFLGNAGDIQGETVLTGHDSGIITINVAEADDVWRERQRVHLHEPYRTLLGHFRHEIGHHYWQRLVAASPLLEGFRANFGDETQDYSAALKNHYDNGAGDWQNNFISAYASVHPWEDWAETWAHYMHMVDVLETASASGLAMVPERQSDPSLRPVARHDFDAMVSAWFPLTYVLNNLSRGLGLADVYPFVLSPVVIGKLRFIHEAIHASRPVSAV